MPATVGCVAYTAVRMVMHDCTGGLSTRYLTIYGRHRQHECQRGIYKASKALLYILYIYYRADRSSANGGNGSSVCGLRSHDTWPILADSGAWTTAMARRLPAMCPLWSADRRELRHVLLTSSPRLLRPRLPQVTPAHHWIWFPSMRACVGWKPHWHWMTITSSGVVAGGRQAKIWRSFFWPMHPVCECAITSHIRCIHTLRLHEVWLAINESDDLQWI